MDRHLKDHNSWPRRFRIVSGRAEQHNSMRTYPRLLDQDRLSRLVSLVSVQMTRYLDTNKTYPLTEWDPGFRRSRVMRVLIASIQRRANTSLFHRLIRSKRRTYFL